MAFNHKLGAGYKASPKGAFRPQNTRHLEHKPMWPLSWRSVLVDLVQGVAWAMLVLLILGAAGVLNLWGV